MVTTKMILSKLAKQCTYIDRVQLKHDLVENSSSNNTLHIFTLLFYATVNGTRTVYTWLLEEGILQVVNNACNC